MTSSIELIFAESGEVRTNAGDTVLPDDRLEPSLSSFLRHFPDAKVTVYTDQDWPSTDRYELRTVENPYGDHPRAGHRFNDFYKAKGVLYSKSDTAIGIDSDLLVVSDDITALPHLAGMFGLCLPANGRWTVRRDALSDCDGGKLDNEPFGSSLSHATGLWARGAHDPFGERLLIAYLLEMSTRPCRGPLALWRAQNAAGISPTTLPPHWLVTGNMPLDHITDPIVLHAGHQNVLDHYAELIGMTA
jgi:hypothetical protein